MYRIGEFSKITSLTVKALHYYDSEGILRPSIRGDNQYRYYSEQDYKRAQLIILLKDLDFSILEIKDFLNQYEDDEDLSYFLKEKKAMIESQIKQKETVLKKFEHYLEPMHLKQLEMNYKIEQQEIAPLLVAYIPYQGKYSDVGTYYATLYKSVKGKAKGAVFNLYYDEEFKEIATVDVCLPVFSSVLTAEVKTKTLPAIKGISTIHVGSYQTLHFAYKALLDYAKENDITITNPTREIYLKGPGMIFRGNPNKYETQIIIPIKEELR